MAYPPRVKCSSRGTMKHLEIRDVFVIADDLIVAGKDEEEHDDEALHRVLRRARDTNVKFSLN